MILEHLLKDISLN